MKIKFFLVACFILASLQNRLTLANPGSLDPTFGGPLIPPPGVDGLVTTDISRTLSDAANSVAIQSDGKIIAAGTSIIGGTNFFSLARYNTDGSLDLTFGATGEGTIVTDFGAGSSDDEGRAVLIQPDGKIVVAGSSASPVPPFDNNFALVRYNTDGTLDMTFGISGRVTTDFLSGSNDIGRSVAIQSDGKIVVTGQSNAGGMGFNFALARYNTNGSLDNTFGPFGVGIITPGLVTTHFPGALFEDGRSVLIQPDNKIVAAGFLTMGVSFDFALTRYNTNGSLDDTFNGTGRVTTDFPSSLDDAAFSVAIQSDGKILAAGASTNTSGGNIAFALARYNTDGILDSAFGTAGLVITDFSVSTTDIANSIAIQSNGRILAAGVAGTDFALSRYRTDGSIDITFGTAGLVTTHFPGSSNNIGNSLVIQSNGKIVIAGVTTAANSNYALARYDGDTVNLSILKVVNRNIVSPGDNVTYTITIANAGPSDSGDAILTDTFPLGPLSLVSVSTSQGSCTGTNSIICDLGTIRAGTSTIITIVATVNALGTIINNANIDPGQVTNVEVSSSTAVLTSFNLLLEGNGGCNLNHSIYKTTALKNLFLSFAAILFLLFFKFRIEQR